MIGCKLPWTAGGSNMEGCSTIEHLTKYAQTIERMMYFGERRYYNMTKCPAPCNYYYYSMKQVHIFRDIEDNICLSKF